MRSTALTGVAAVAVAVGAYGCSSTQESVRAIRPVAAHWVTNPDAYEPNMQDFALDALSFPMPTEGWIVGDRYLVHVYGDEIFVTFIGPLRHSISNAEFRSSGEGWIGGFDGDRLPPSEERRTTPSAAAAIWHYHSGQWRYADLSEVHPISHVFAIRGAPDGTVWAMVSRDLPADMEHPPARRRFRMILLRSDDGDTWRIEPAPREGDRRWALFDACFLPSGEGWFVGSDVSDPDAPRALAVSHRDGAWHRAALQIDPRLRRLRQIECLADGHAFALAYRDGVDDLHVVSQLLRYDGQSWQELDLPDAFQESGIAGIAPVSPSELWLAVNGVGQPPTFLRWRDGEWALVPPPPLPNNRVDGYNFTGIQFVSPTEGWAIASDYAGSGLQRGLIFHYKDGVWRRRSWNWHFWNAPGWDLFGH